MVCVLAFALTLYRPGASPMASTFSRLECFLRTARRQPPVFRRENADLRSGCLGCFTVRFAPVPLQRLRKEPSRRDRRLAPVPLERKTAFLLRTAICTPSAGQRCDSQQCGPLIRWAGEPNDKASAGMAIRIKRCVSETIGRKSHPMDVAVPRPPCFSPDRSPQCSEWRGFSIQ